MHGKLAEEMAVEVSFVGVLCLTRTPQLQEAEKARVQAERMLAEMSSMYEHEVTTPWLLIGHVEHSAYVTLL